LLENFGNIGGLVVIGVFLIPYAGVIVDV
jgi:hypothetical protein